MLLPGQPKYKGQGKQAEYRGKTAQVPQWLGAMLILYPWILDSHAILGLYKFMVITLRQSTKNYRAFHTTNRITAVNSTLLFSFKKKDHE